MHRRDLPTSLDLLRGFEASARLLSFTAAAAELFVTQSAVSRQVQQLEEQLGVKLFERRTRALVLTDAGDRYFRDVAKALSQLREATAAVRERTAPVVRVTTTLTFASLWLVPRLAAFQKEHAEISVHVVADNVVRDLERNSLDVALRYCPEEAAGAGAERLFGEEVAPVAAPTLLKGQRIRDVGEMLRLPLIELEDPTGTALWLSWKVWCEAMGVARPRTSRGLTFSHYDQVVQAAVAGQGVALGRFPLLDPFVAERRLTRPLKGRQYATLARRTYWLVVAPGAAQRPEVKTFSAWLRRQVAAQRQPT
ncbi:MAG TPA: LysR substrate-binding domain-containing protein [Burkholderiaceae bacterium]|nr:LysR substrate-binding domain-containing protein [Burkholderiaceae bacterium]HQR72608.1 LysR substrate-binding domain-containing protein [Burkholderiaceae bacterium]